VCHLVSHDYAYASHYSSRLQGSLSLNAAIFACVLLAARLPSTTHVFALTSLGALCFMLLPALSRTLHALPATQACRQYSSRVSSEYGLSGPQRACTPHLTLAVQAHCAAGHCGARRARHRDALLLLKASRGAPAGPKRAVPVAAERATHGSMRPRACVRLALCAPGLQGRAAAASGPHAGSGPL
jgi:hypothetical protein